MLSEGDTFQIASVGDATTTAHLYIGSTLVKE